MCNLFIAFAAKNFNIIYGQHYVWAGIWEEDSKRDSIQTSLPQRGRSRESRLRPTFSIVVQLIRYGHK